MPKKTSLNVSVVSEKTSSTAEGPVVLRFPNGAPPLADTEFSLQHLSKAASGPRLKAHRQLVAAVTDNCRFVGDNFGPYAASKIDNCQYAVAVFDRKNKSLVLHPAKNTFTMNVQVHTRKNIDEDTLSQLTNRAKRQLLVNEFGSRKRRRDQKSQEASRITSTNITGGEAVQALLAKSAADREASGASTTSSQQQALADNRRAFLPPFDAEATEQQNVYKIDALLWAKGALDRRAKKFLNFLKDAAAFNEAKTAPRKNDLNSFLVQVITEHLADDERLPPAELKQKAQLMAMCSYLAKFHRLPHRFSGTSIAEIAKKYYIPEPIMKRFCTLFADVDTSEATFGAEESAHIRVSRSDEMKDKVVIWTLAVCLHICSFTCSMKELAADLEVPGAKLGQYFRLLGCTTKSNKAVLNAPPKFPRRSRGRAK